MDYTNARKILANQVDFRRYCKVEIEKNQNCYDEADRQIQITTPNMKNIMLEWTKKCDVFNDVPGLKKKIQQQFRVKLNRLANVQWRIKYFDSLRKLYAYIHNFDIDKAEHYFDKVKELSHEGMEINERLCDVDPEYGICIHDRVKDTKAISDNEYAYKVFCDNMMGAIKIAEKNMGHCKKFIIAKKVIQAKKNMITRQKKRKH